MENSEVKKQWHGPFCSAVRLELMENKADFDFQQEYQLSTKPLQIDFLVIRRTESYNPVANEIGKIFRGHNLMEYKSPEYEMNVDTYFKVLGYACLYKALGEGVDAIKDDDITLSLVREGYPRELFRYFEKRGYTIKEKYPGIYYVLKEGFFPIQVIVSRRLDKELHVWLTSLTRDMKVSEAERLVCRIGMLTEKDDRMNASAVFGLASKANKKIFEEVKEDGIMFEEMRELVWPSYDEDVKKAAGELAKEQVDAAAKATAENLMKECGFSLEKACRLAGISVEDYERVKASEAKLKALEANPDSDPEIDGQ